jgi:hypothetical protein
MGYCMMVTQFSYPSILAVNAATEAIKSSHRQMPRPHRKHNVLMPSASNFCEFDTYSIPIDRGVVNATATLDVTTRMVLGLKMTVTLDAHHARAVIEQIIAR